MVIGDRKSEQAHSFKGEKTGAGKAFGHRWRHGTGWFSYRMTVRPEGGQSVFCTYWGGDGGNRKFEILMDDVMIGSQAPENNKPGEFLGVEYPVPWR